jgi:hypothetical protein
LQATIFPKQPVTLQQMQDLIEFMGQFCVSQVAKIVELWLVSIVQQGLRSYEDCCLELEELASSSFRR